MLRQVDSRDRRVSDLPNRQSLFEANNDPDSMNSAEKIFLSEIDCRFPYDNLGQCMRLIDRGIATSPNAAFGALHEIGRPPRSAKTSTGRLMQLMEYWRSNFDHPAADMLAEVATSSILGRTLEVEDVIAKMGILAEYPGLYAALAILYFSCEDSEEKLEPIAAAIRKRWSASPNDP